MNVVLVEPEIPQNTGNIARTCAVTGSRLHLVKPLGFSTEDRYLKRAGLDYWKYVDISYYENLDEFFDKNRGVNGNFFYATTKGKRYYTEVHYSMGDYLVFGKETGGLPEELLHSSPERCIRIPMVRHVRSLNLGNSVAIILYHALYSQGFPEMS